MSPPSEGTDVKGMDVMSNRPRRVLLAAAVLAVVAVGTYPASAANLDISICDPNAGVHFTADVNNSYFPLPTSPAPGQWILTGVDKGVPTSVRITVGGTAPFYGGRVKTRQVEEFEWQDTNNNGVVDPGEPVTEDSLNWFAQTTNGTNRGTVCYFGEVVNGDPSAAAGSWRADDPSGQNQPGIFMPAMPRTGQSFFQESAPGVAQDQAEIIGVGTVTVLGQPRSDVIRVREFNKAEKDKGYKLYAPGIGTVADDTLNLISFTP